MRIFSHLCGYQWVFRGSLLWIFIIPLAAKLVVFIKENHGEFGYLGFTINNIELPFSWALLYLTSLSFAIASIIFIFRCPKIIQEVGNFGDFSAQGRSDMEIKELFQQYLDFNKRKSHHEIPNDIDTKIKFFDFIECCTGRNDERPDNVNLQLINTESLLDIIYKNMKITRGTEAFKMMWDEVKTINPLARYMCNAFYIIGYALLTIIFFQNMKAIISIYLPLLN